MNEDPFLVATLFEDYATQEHYVLGRPHVIWRYSDSQIACMFNLLNNSFRPMFGWDHVAVCCGWCLMRMTSMPCKNTCPSCIDWFCSTFSWHQQLRFPVVTGIPNKIPNKNFVVLLNKKELRDQQSKTSSEYLWLVLREAPSDLPEVSTPISLVKIGMGGFPPKEHDPTRKNDSLQVLAFSLKFVHVASKKGCLHPKSQDKDVNSFDFSRYLLRRCLIGMFLWGYQIPSLRRSPWMSKDMFLRSIAKPVAESFCLKGNLFWKKSTGSPSD